MQHQLEYIKNSVLANLKDKNYLWLKEAKDKNRIHERNHKRIHLNFKHNFNLLFNLIFNNKNYLHTYSKLRNENSFFSQNLIYIFNKNIN